MALLEDIKKEQMVMRKAKRTPEVGILTLLIGETLKVGKDNGNRLPTDEEVVAVIKKFIKNCNDNMSVSDPSSEFFQKSQSEVEYLSKFLPRQLSENEIRAFVLDEIDSAGGVPNMKMMGSIMKSLTTKFPGQVDGKEASKIVRGTLQG